MSSVPQDRDLTATGSVSPVIRFLVVVVGVLCISFVGLLVWASRAGAFVEEMALLASVPWGLVAIMDVYLGLFLVAV